MLIKVELIIGIIAGSIAILAFAAKAYANIRAARRARREDERREELRSIEHE